jgi:hypothetical protein
VEIIANRPPTVEAGGPYSVDEGASIEVSASGSDPDDDPLIYAWDLDNDGSFETEGQSATFLAIDGPDSHIISAQVTDPGGLTAVDQATVTVNNVPPEVGSITAPIEPIQVNVVIAATAVFADPGILDTHIADWDWGDGITSEGTVDEMNGSGSVSDTHIYTEPGVHTVVLTVTDKDGGVGTAVYNYVVVYDPEGGFVTGGGWIDSPPGACNYDACTYDTTGKATFGFVSKYKKGAQVPTGNTEFQFTAGDLNFHSSSYDWLVVAGAHAKYKGTGTINGSGSYSFMITATDSAINGSGTVDGFRIKIWDDNGVVYDNKMGESDDSYDTTDLSGGSIVIHKN